MDHREHVNEDYLFRFGGIARLYGQDALQKFHDAHIAVVGLGGVGSWAAESLVRSGIGAITLFDMDDICVSNTNRQIHADSLHVGQMKSDAMGDRLMAINPDLLCHRENLFITPSNVADCLDGRFNYIFDATDSVKAKTAMIAHCVRYRIPMITSGGAGGQMDPSQIRVSDLSVTHQDPLLAKVRNNLRRHHGFSRDPKKKFKVPAIYSEEQLTYAYPDGSVGLQKPDAMDMAKLDCAGGLGAITHVTAVFGLVGAGHILKSLAR